MILIDRHYPSCEKMFKAAIKLINPCLRNLLIKGFNMSIKPQATTRTSPPQKQSHEEDLRSEKSPLISPNKQHPSTEQLTSAGVTRKKGPTTRIIVKYDVGFNNSIYLRGDGADLSWERGIMLKNVKSDEWIWETNIPFTKCEFKVLINDRQYELGENHRLQCGTSFEYTPNFHIL